MDDTRKPRHIRDIAHLYLSRMSRETRRHRVWVLAASRECFGAYHAANLALGFAWGGSAVELVEVSGALPCAAYFLQLPPRVYLRHKALSPEDPVSALGGVKLRFAVGERSQTRRDSAPGAAVGEPSRRRGRRVEVSHFPPASERDALRESLTLAREKAGGGEIRALVLAADEARALEAGRRWMGLVPGIRWSTLSLERRVAPGDRSGGGRSLGYLLGWRQLLSDPVPCVARDPESHVSRSYRSICEELLTAVSTTKERHEQKKRHPSASVGRTG